MYERPFLKFVYIDGRLRRGKIIDLGDEDYVHGRLVPAPLRKPEYTDQMIAGWISLKTDRAIATSWPPWDEMREGVRQSVQKALQRWCDAQKLPLTFAIFRIKRRVD